MANSTIITAFAAILVSLFIGISFLLAFYLWRTRSKYIAKPVDTEKQIGYTSEKPHLELQIPNTDTSQANKFQSAIGTQYASPYDANTVINDSASTLFYNKTMTSAASDPKTDKPFICVSYDDVDDDDSTDYDSDHFEEKTKISSYSPKSSKISAKMMAERHQTLLNSHGPKTLSMFEKKSNSYLNNYPHKKMSSYFANPPQAHSNQFAKDASIADHHESPIDTIKRNSVAIENKRESVYTNLIYDLYAEKIDDSKFSSEPVLIDSSDPPPVPLKDSTYLTRPNRTLYN